MKPMIPAGVLAVLAVALPHPAPAASRSIDYLAETCFSCHRSGAAGAIPSLTGRPGFEIIKGLQDYRDGTRVNPIMSAIAGELDPNQIGMLAAYLAKQR